MKLRKNDDEKKNPKGQNRKKARDSGVVNGPLAF